MEWPLYFVQSFVGWPWENYFINFDIEYAVVIIFIVSFFVMRIFRIWCKMMNSRWIKWIPNNPNGLQEIALSYKRRRIVLTVFICLNVLYCSVFLLLLTYLLTMLGGRPHTDLDYLSQHLSRQFNLISLNQVVIKFNIIIENDVKATSKSRKNACDVEFWRSVAGSEPRSSD